MLVNRSDFCLRDVHLKLLQKRGEGSLFAKAVANAMYGRLAMRLDNRVTRWGVFAEDEICSPTFHRKYKAYEDVVVYEGGVARGGVERNLGWAAAITARGRAQLMRLMRECEVGGHVVTGVNTDSVTLSGVREVEVGGKLFARLQGTRIHGLCTSRLAHPTH